MTTLRAMARKIEAMETRYQKMMRLLEEDGLLDRPFSRREAAMAWGVPPTKASDYLTELKELGLVRRMQAEGFHNLWAKSGLRVATHRVPRTPDDRGKKE